MLQYSPANFLIFGGDIKVCLDGCSNAILKNAREPLGLCPVPSKHCVTDVGGQSVRVVWKQVTLDPTPQCLDWTRPGCLWSPRSSTRNGSSGLNSN